MDDMTPYENLANAIILKAVKDYRMSNCEGTLRELEKFFRSKWFKVLTKIDGEKLIQDLRREKTDGR